MVLDDIVGVARMGFMFFVCGSPLLVPFCFVAFDVDGELWGYLGRYLWIFFYDIVGFVNIEDFILDVCLTAVWCFIWFRVEVFKGVTGEAFVG